MNQETNTKIATILSQANISLKDQEMWQTRLEASDDSFSEAFLATFENDPELLRFATVDIKSHILAQGNPAELKKISAREQEYLRLLSESETL